MTSYSGNCHCGAIKYNVKLPKLETVTACNCSICSKKGYLWTFPESDDHFTLEEGDGEMKGYQFGKKSMTHYFCPKCGTPVMAKRSKGMGLNARTIQDVDISQLKINTFDGAAMDPVWEPPNFPDTPSNKDDEKVYHGSCHCKAVSFSVQSPEIKEVTECNCSICSRNAYLWIYPPSPAVTIHNQGQSNLEVYYFNKKIAGHAFCKTCGVPLLNQPKGEYANMAPVNVRTLEGFNMEGVKKKQVNGRDASIGG